MINRLYIPFVFLLCLACSAGSAFGAENSSDLLSGKNSGDGETCRLIKDNITRGVDAKSVTKTNIQLGHNVCYVVKCAIDGGGELSLIVMGAVEAGSTPDVVSRCCTDAGAEPWKIAQILENMGEGFGYSSPKADFIPIDPFPARTTARRFISPSAF